MLRLLLHWCCKYSLLALELVIGLCQLLRCFLCRVAAAQRPLRVELVDEELRLELAAAGLLDRALVSRTLQRRQIRLLGRSGHRLRIVHCPAGCLQIVHRGVFGSFTRWDRSTLLSSFFFGIQWVRGNPFRIP